MVGTKLRSLHVILRPCYKIKVAHILYIYISYFHYLHLIVSRSLRLLLANNNND